MQTQPLWEHSKASSRELSREQEASQWEGSLILRAEYKPK